MSYPIGKHEENEKLKREIAELKAMVNELRSGIDNAFKSYSAGVADMSLRKAINKTPAQSLHDHDMAIAEAVRGLILSVTERKNAYDLVAEVEENIRNIDLAPIVKGVK